METMPQKPGEPTMVTEITPEDRTAARREKAAFARNDGGARMGSCHDGQAEMLEAA